MNWVTGYGVNASIGLQVGPRESVSLRLSPGAGPYLTIGSSIEILLDQAHVIALREQAEVVIAGLLALEHTEDNVEQPV